MRTSPFNVTPPVPEVKLPVDCVIFPDTVKPLFNVGVALHINVFVGFIPPNLVFVAY